MPGLVSIGRNMLALAVLAAGGCGGMRDQAVSGCPHCGDPTMRRGPDGHMVVVPRWRLAAPVAPARARPAAADADGARGAAVPR